MGRGVNASRPLHGRPVPRAREPGETPKTPTKAYLQRPGDDIRVVILLTLLQFLQDPLHRGAAQIVALHRPWRGKVAVLLPSRPGLRRSETPPDSCRADLGASEVWESKSRRFAMDRTGRIHFCPQVFWPGSLGVTCSPARFQATPRWRGRERPPRPPASPSSAHHRTPRMSILHGRVPACK